MKKKAFKAESKRLLDLMINSIYTHKEIFLREIISNASDAIDKLCYLSLTDDKVGLNRDQFEIKLSIDKEHRLLTVSDNGIGMSQEELPVIRKLLEQDSKHLDRIQVLMASSREFYILVRLQLLQKAQVRNKILCRLIRRTHHKAGTYLVPDVL